MSKNKTDSTKKQFKISSLSSNNKAVFVFALLLAVVFWCIVSMSETTETERVFQNVIVKINTEGSLPQKYNLEIFGQKEYKVNVTVKGLSYLVNDSSFTSDDISVTASCSSVINPGVHTLPLTYSVSNPALEIVNVSAQSIDVSFDKLETKTFAINPDIQYGDNYSVAENIILERPVLSKDEISISGPSMVLSQISEVYAYVFLESEVNSSLILESELIAKTSGGEVVNLSDCTVDQIEPVRITIAAKRTGVYKTDIEFTNVPSFINIDSVSYSVNPGEIEVKVDVNSVADDTVSVARIDFSKLRAGNNIIAIENKELLSDVNNFNVTVDMSAYSEQWISDIVISKDELPENIEVITGNVDHVIVVCEQDIYGKVSNNDLYAVPLLGDKPLSAGVHTVPVKICIRTLENCWIYYGDAGYTVDIEVK